MSTEPAVVPSQTRVGRAFYVGGGLLLAVLLGVAIGYWLSDRGLPWLRTMLPALLVFGLIGLVAMAYGSLRLGATGWRRARRRTIALLALALLAALVRLLVHFATQPAPLSTMSAEAYAVVAAADQVQVQVLSANLEQIVRRLAELPKEEMLSAQTEVWAKDAWRGFVDASFALDQLRRYHEDYYRLDLSRLERDRHLRSFMLSFVAELTLYQATSAAMEALSQNPSAWRFLDLPRPELGLAAGSVTRARDALAGVSDLSRVIAGQRYLDYLDAVHHAAAEAEGRGFLGLHRELRARLAELGQSQAFRQAAQAAVAADLMPAVREAKDMVFPVQAGVAEWMGDTRVRQAGRYLISADLVEQLARKLAPGDILLARKNWYLSNLALPGFWPHAALHVGTTRQLAQEFDDDPEVQVWLEKALGVVGVRYTEYLARRYPRAWANLERSEAGPEPVVVIEALSEGVSQSALGHVTGDYVAALRPLLGKTARAKAVLQAFGYLGRPYDFDFDFNTDDSLVCTEVVWRAYRPELLVESGLSIPGQSIAGRFTVPANEFAKLYAQGVEGGKPELELVAFIEGREKTGSAVFADEKAFVATATRPKWDIAQP